MYLKMPKESYSIIWKHFEKDSETGKHLKAQDRFSLPYFVDGIDKKQFDKRLSANLNPLHLIKGLLVGYFDKPPGADPSFAKQKIKEIITEQLDTFKSDTVENLILDFSAHLREKNGQEASLQALMTGTEIVPNSNSIKYDCCLDLFNCLEDDLLSERQAAIQKLSQLLHDIDPSKIDRALFDDYEYMKKEINKY